MRYETPVDDVDENAVLTLYEMFFVRHLPQDLLVCQ